MGTTGEQRRKKLLILYERTGTGHEAMAKTLEEILGDEPGWTLELVAGSDLMQDSSVDLIVGLWDELIRRDWITLADWIVNRFLRSVLVPAFDVFGSRKFHQRIVEMRPDALICTADGYNRALGMVALQEKIPFFIIPTEFSVFCDQVRPEATHICFFPSTLQAIRRFDFFVTPFSIQIPPDAPTSSKLRYIVGFWRNYVVGFRSHPLVRHPDLIAPDSAEPKNLARGVAVGPIRSARHFASTNRDVMRDRLGIGKETDCVLVISGGIGGSFISRAITGLQRFRTTPLTVLAVCGRDSRCQAEVARLATRPSAVDVRVFGFVDNLPELMAACDVIIARPSAGIVQEALLAKVPLLLPERVTANDLGANLLVSKYGLGGIFRDARQLESALDEILGDINGYQDRITDFMRDYQEFRALKEALRETIFGENTPDPAPAREREPQDRERAPGALVSARPEPPPEPRLGG